MPDGAGTSREREGAEGALRCARRNGEENRALGGKPKTRGCGTGAGTYEQAGTRAWAKERAEGAEGKLGGGCFAFLIRLKHVNATPSS